MANVKRSPSAGFAIADPTVLTGEKTWFQTLFNAPNLTLENCVVFDYTHLQNLITSSTQYLCFSKQTITNAQGQTKNTLACAPVDKNDTFVSKVLVGNLFPDISISALQNETLTGWEVAPPTNRVLQSSNLQIVWRTYQDAPTSLSTFFLTVSFHKNKFSALEEGVTRIAFFPGFADLEVEFNHSSGIPVEKWQAHLQILAAFGVDDNNQILTKAIYPDASWPVKYPPYNDAS